MNELTMTCPIRKGPHFWFRALEGLGASLAICFCLALGPEAHAEEQSRLVVTTNYVVVTNIVLVTNVVMTTGPVPATTPVASAALADINTNSYSVFWWSDGIRYRCRQAIVLGTTNELGAPLVNERLRLTGRLGVKLSLDAAAFVSTEGQEPVSNRGEVRTARFYTMGDFTWKFPIYYKLELGVVDDSFYLHEAFLRFQEIPYLKNITIGYIGAPLTMENVMSFGDLTFMEPAAPAQAFGPGNRAALQFDGTWRGQRMSYQVGFYGVGQEPGFNFGDASESLARGMARVTGLPVYEEETNRYRLLHLGAALSYTFSDSSQIHYEARPESHLAPFLVDTGEIQARNASQLGLEAAYVNGPFSLQGELTGSWVADTDSGSQAFWGAYGYASWFLTGEHRVYDQALGVFGRLAPEDAFSPFHNKWGAIELAARASYLDLSDGLIDGGRMVVLMPGVNWYWSRHLRVQANYGWADVLDGPHAGNLHIFQARLQMYF
jgi:phosphate-selective porin OprO and OprP